MLMYFSDFSFFLIKQILLPAYSVEAGKRLIVCEASALSAKSTALNSKSLPLYCMIALRSLIPTSPALSSAPRRYTPLYRVQNHQCLQIHKIRRFPYHILNATRCHTVADPSPESLLYSKASRESEKCRHRKTPAAASVFNSSYSQLPAVWHPLPRPVLLILQNIVLIFAKLHHLMLQEFLLQVILHLHLH